MTKTQFIFVGAGYAILLFVMHLSGTTPEHPVFWYGFAPWAIVIGVVARGLD